MTDREQIVFLNSSLEIELSIDRSKLTQIIDWCSDWFIGSSPIYESSIISKVLRMNYPLNRNKN